MSHIQPLPHLSNITADEAPWKNRRYIPADDSTTIYPKLKSGQSVRVVIIRRSVKIVTPGTDPFGQPFPSSVLHVCRNAGKWSFRIDYARKQKTTRMNASTFREEASRMGVSDELLRWLISG